MAGFQRHWTHQVWSTLRERKRERERKLERERETEVVSEGVSESMSVCVSYLCVVLNGKDVIVVLVSDIDIPISIAVHRKIPPVRSSIDFNRWSWRPKGFDDWQIDGNKVLVTSHHKRTPHVLETCQLLYGFHERIVEDCK